MSMLSVSGNVCVKFARLSIENRRIDGESVRVIKLCEKTLDCEDSEHL